MFVPLHTHSEYSLLDSACRIADLVTSAVTHGCPALALTDRDSLAGAVEFVTACTKSGVKPILGAEISLEDGSHLTLLCATEKGYANLCKLISRPQGNERTKPSLSNVLELSGGLIALSGCRKGRVPSLLSQGKMREAEIIAAKLARAFHGRFLIELFHHKPEDFVLRQRLLEFADKLNLPALPTPNVHYINHGDFRLWQAVSSVRTLTLIDQAHPEKTLTGEYHFRTPAEMEELFGASLTEKTVAVAAMCDFELI